MSEQVSVVGRRVLWASQGEAATLIYRVTPTSDG